MTFCTLTLSFNHQKKKKEKTYHPKPPWLSIPCDYKPSPLSSGLERRRNNSKPFSFIGSCPSNTTSIASSSLLCWTFIEYNFQICLMGSQAQCNSDAIPFTWILKQLLSMYSLFGHVRFCDWCICISDAVLYALSLKFDETRFTDVVFCFFLKRAKITNINCTLFKCGA